MVRAALVVLVSLSACDPAAPVRVAERSAEDGPSDLFQGAGDPRGMAPPDDLEVPPPGPLLAVPAPVAQAYCDIVVEGVSHATETDYIPHVIQCENGGADFEALKAQAIAARSVAYYAMYNDGEICDGQGCQVYSCGAEPQQIHYDAAAATAGQYLSYNGWVTYGFYVAGDPQQPPSCIDTDNGNVAGTEKFVTFNEGKTVYDVDQTTLGFVFPEDLNVGGYGQNRGCMSQWGARCLEATKGYASEGILRFYYGADIEVLQAQGPCVAPPNQPAAGTLEAVDCALGLSGWAWDPDAPDTAINTYVSFLAPFGDPNAASFTVLANGYRDDLCQSLGSCEHGLSLALPRSLQDGLPHPVHVYGVDTGGGGPTELAGSPIAFTCAPPALPPGVRRHVPNPAALAAWSLDTFWQLAKIPDATLQAIPLRQPIAAAPALVQVAGDPTLWLVDGGFRRRVPSPEVAAAWQFDVGSAQIITLAELMAMPQGTDVWPGPFMVQGTDPEVYLLDDPQCPPGGDPLDPLCPPAPATTGDGTTDTGTGADSETGGDLPTTGETPGTGGPDGSSGGGTLPDPASGGALPPGYGLDEGGCACDGGAGARPLPWALLVLVAVRRRRRRTGPDVREVSSHGGRGRRTRDRARAPAPKPL